MLIWYLKDFDEAIINGLNPVYYGRYVDDVIIVDKVEKSSDIYSKAREGKLEKKECFEFFLSQCTKWNGISKKNCNNSNEKCKNDRFSLFIEDKGDYKLNKEYQKSKNSNSDISIQESKLKIFYFKSDETTAMIKCFQDEIAKNKSEFRYLPEDENVFSSDDYEEIYNLRRGDSINKLRDVDSISINKFSLSKYLGKHLKIGSLISDNVEKKFEKDIVKIFDNRAIIENYTAWEKVLEILVINNRFDASFKFTKKIYGAIESIVLKDGYCDLGEKIKDSLKLFLLSALYRVFALNWGEKVNKTIHKIEQIFEKDPDFLEIKNFDYFREGYLKTRMVDRYVIPIDLDIISNNIDSLLIENGHINLTNFNHLCEVLQTNIIKSSADYYYYPYMISVNDISINKMFLSLFNKETGKTNQETNSLDQILKEYIEKNYKIISEDYLDSNDFIKSSPISMYDIPKSSNESNKLKYYYYRVGNEKKDRIRISVANAIVKEDDFLNAIKGKPNRSLQRYNNLVKIINESIKEKAELLVLPESYLPFEWLPIVARTCAKNQIALITGIEHIRIDKKVINLTAIILPYKHFLTENKIDFNKMSYIAFQIKRHYSPGEIKFIEGYNLEYIEGNDMNLYSWNNICFSVYCCFELSSIKERSIFQSYSDITFAVEHNSDINYFGNIIESLSRDLHCYCVQVNSSFYGDTRITAPKKTEAKDLIKIKGGKNSSVLIDELDILSLREFQLKSYTLQSEDKRFKMTPPDFNNDIVRKKNNNILFENNIK